MSRPASAQTVPDILADDAIVFPGDLALDELRRALDIAASKRLDGFSAGAT